MAVSRCPLFVHSSVIARSFTFSRHCGPTRVGQSETSGHHFLWIQEKAANGDLNFKKVAGVDNGADLFTKTLSWNEVQSHIHQLSSQFVQNEISVNNVGARPNGGTTTTKNCVR